MLAYTVDRERTQAAYRERVLRDKKKRSFYNMLGHIFLRGVDREAQWSALYSQRKGICESCHRWRPKAKLDMNHLGRTPKTRCDCLCQPLNDGSTCTGISLLCTMHPAKGGGPDSCHARWHNRELGGKRKT
jgi:coenzyme F420-reducing hydrogenase gamma subunit